MRNPFWTLVCSWEDLRRHGAPPRSNNRVNTRGGLYFFLIRNFPGGPREPFFPIVNKYIIIRYRNITHPTCKEVVRMLRGIAAERAIYGEVLVIGDSTSAHCVERAGEVSWREMRYLARNSCDGVSNSHFESWSGATPRSSMGQARNASRWGRTYDWVLLIGGWNSYGISRDEIEGRF